MSGHRVTHVITGLELGGAEIILVRLLEDLAATGERPDHRVISLTSRGPLGDRVEAAGYPLEAMDLRRFPGPVGISRLARTLKASQPDIVQTWLLHSNVLAGSLARMRRIAPVCWSMHMTAAQAGTHGRAQVALQSLESRLSHRVPNRIVSCSHSTYELMAESGYELSGASVVPNGFDTERLAPDPVAGAELRSELGIPADALIVAHAARLHAMKDHANLLAAAALVSERVENVHFVMCGTGVTDADPGLAAGAVPLGPRAHLLGPRGDVERIFQAADVGALSSASGEAMPLVIGEAMACGTPFVATDCGDAAELIGDTGVVVPVRDAPALAAGLEQLLSEAADRRAERGERARRRIAERYSMDGMIAGYEAVWDELSPSSSSRTA